MGHHVIRTKADLPHKDKVRRTPHKWKDNISQQVGEMLDNKIIRASSSPYSSNILLTNKKDGTKRFCIDFRSLNKNTVKDTYPLPNVEDMIDSFKDCCFFTQVDLASAYWGIPVNPEDVDKTAFATHMGKFECLRMPFGLVNAQATFQRVMDSMKEKVRKEGLKGIDVYVDNIIVFTKTFEEHTAILRRLFHHLDTANFSLRLDKSEFAKSEIDFLGFIVDGKTVKPTPENVQKVKEYPQPTTRKKLQQFLGMANFNRKFIPRYSEIVAPLSSLTSSKVTFKWGEVHQAVFASIKQHLSDAPGLFLADWNKPFHIETDASKIGVGAVLYQSNDEGQQLPLGYFSKTLSKTEQNWHTTEQEMFAIVCASRKWAPYCTSRVIFHTDHLPLKYIRSQKDPRGKIARWIMELENIDYQVEYIPGKNNVQADYLSRIKTKQESSAESMQEQAAVYYERQTLPTLSTIRKEQQKDPSFQDALQQLDVSGKITKGIFKSHSNIAVKDKLLWKGSRIMIPKALYKSITQEFHGQYHHGGDNTVLLIKARFYWRGMERYIQDFVAACRTCTQCKVAKGQHSTTQIPEVPLPRDKLGIDIACMPLSHRGNTYMLQMIDMNTKFVATAALSDQQATTIKSSLWPKWFAYFGVPSTILSDQGRNVDGNVIRDLCRQLNIVKIHSSPYHPEGNGSTERSIGSVKAILRAMCQSRGISVHEWDSLLDEATLAYNNTINKSSGYSPFRSMFGSDATLPIDNVCGVRSGTASAEPSLIRTNADINRSEAQTSYKTRLDLKANTESFTAGDKVLIKRTYGSYPKMAVKWKEDSQEKPYTVIKCIGPVNYAIENSKGIQKIYHRNMLRHAKAKLEPGFTPSKTLQNTHKEQAVTHITVQASTPSPPEQASSAQPSIDNEVFTDNVFRSRDAVAQPIPQPLTSRYGRILRPVERLNIREI